LPADYAALAPIYDETGMGNFAHDLTPRLINYAQRNEWLGRRILDLGCGTGASLLWLARHGYILTGIDNAPQMLAIARSHLESGGLSCTLHERDIREPGADFNTFDMVLALDVLNELNSLRDLEAVFKAAAGLLSENKLFIFDIYTIQGMTERGTSGHFIIHDAPNLAVFSHSHYDYDRQAEERRYIIFQRQDDCWRRSEAARTLRAYPVQAITGLLQRNGFQHVQVLNLNLQPFETASIAANRVIFVAEKR
jgi:2-polyprenyl-3-methyl-5-hydroxy-6-metoxy-1,4-benzoquinol methylase